MAIRRLLIALLLCSAFGAAQNPPPSLTTIYSFAGGSDGWDSTLLTIGHGGVLFGATTNGGVHGFGTIFSLTPPASPGGSWTHTVLYNFQGGTDGENPDTRLTIGTGGVLYGGTTYSATGSAEIYSLTPPASPGGQWTLAVIAAFGAEGPSSVALSPGGVLYGTVATSALCGSAFALLPPASPGGSWTEQTVKNFECAGSAPTIGLAIGAGLTLYGVNPGFITIPAEVFALAPPATPGGAWTETVLYTFVGIIDGPTDLAIGGGGALYGTVSSNGGAVYSLTPPASPGGSWSQATLLEFPSSPRLISGVVPGPVTLGEDGTVFGTTQYGGASGAGTAYALKPPASPGGAWKLIHLHTFTGSDGKYPMGLAMGAGGVLYGVTREGGAYGHGTVFALAE